MPRPHQHWAYVWVPIFGANVWWCKSPQLDTFSHGQSDTSLRDAVGNAHYMACSGKTPLCLARWEHCIYLRCRGRHTQTIIHNGMFNNSSLILSLVSHRAVAAAFRTVRSVLYLIASKALIHLQIGRRHAQERTGLLNPSDTRILPRGTWSNPAFHLRHQASYECAPSILARIHCWCWP